MSKKNKSKFKKRIKAQILNEMASANQKETLKFEPQAKISPSVKPALDPEQTSPVSNINPSSDNISTEPLDYTKKDLKKSAFIIGPIILIIVGLFIADAKTNILAKTGNIIFNFFNINT